ncbi:MAG: hypothetical protein WCA79_06540 [Anaerolineales bacterium]
MAGDTGHCAGHLADSTLMNLLRAIIRRFDNWLSHVEGVEPFTDDPQCILRIQFGRVIHDITFPNQVIRSDASALFIHFWNEHMPVIPDEGADLSYGLKLQRLAIYSMKRVAEYIQSNPSLSDVQVIGGITTFISREAADGGRKSFEHLGFTIFPYARTEGAFGEFWENFYGWWLMWAYNPVSARYRKMQEMQHTEFWMAREKFLERFGKT